MCERTLTSRLVFPLLINDLPHYATTVHFFFAAKEYGISSQDELFSLPIGLNRSIK